MNFKKPKEELLSEIRNRASYSVSQTVLTLSGHDAGPVISNAIANAVEQAFRVMIDNVYTDAEFEEDLQLRNKS